MFVEALLAVAFQVGPFYQQKPDYAALRPLWSSEGRTTDVLWPLFTAHDDWWRCCFFMHYQDYGQRGYQFEMMPLWWNGRGQLEAKTGEGAFYCGLFPIAGYHPHMLLIHEWKFVLWPIWMQYKMPRREKFEDGTEGEIKWMKTNAVLFPFIHWRDDGSWGFWPIYGKNQQRASFHQYWLWPIFTFADYYHEDKDSAGKGKSLMIWPLFGGVSRERETQYLFLPPLFSYDTTPQGWRLRCPWPIFEFERRANRDRSVVFPIYEHSVLKEYATGKSSSNTMRFGWKLIELYDDETRVFPIWANRHDGSFYRLWPFWERQERKAAGVKVRESRYLSLFPIRWVDNVDRNWAKFWTLYETEEWPLRTYHSLLWGIIRWTTEK